MGALERAVDWLRPLVKTKEWDYCVIWKLGDDPSRFIELMDCCCGGGEYIIVKEENGVKEEQYLLPLCRDVHFQHPAMAMGCQTLTQYPASLSLYSGIHGEVAISNQPRWLTPESSSNPNYELVGTQVIVPVDGGLIELFSTKNVPKDQKLIDFIASQYNVSMEHEIMSNTDKSLKENPHDPFGNEYSNNQYHLNFIPRLQNFLPVSQASPYFNIEGSSTGSTPSNEHPSLNSGSNHVSPFLSPKNSIGKSSESWKLNCILELSKNEKVKAAALCAKRVIDQKDKLKGRQRTEKEPYQSKNLVTERNRRIRIKDGLFALRALVPKITKMDRAAILGDAIDYIEEMKQNIKDFETELCEMDEEDSSRNIFALVPEMKWSNEGSTIADQKPQLDVQVDINQIGTREFLLKFIYNQKQGGFLRLMEAIHSLRLQVIDANVTTCNGRVLNILKVEANQEEVEPENLKDSLLTSLTCQPVV